jgi:hypothetical protein
MEITTTTPRLQTAASKKKDILNDQLNQYCDAVHAAGGSSDSGLRVNSPCKNVSRKVTFIFKPL